MTARSLWRAQDPSVRTRVHVCVHKLIKWRLSSGPPKGWTPPSLPSLVCFLVVCRALPLFQLLTFALSTQTFCFCVGGGGEGSHQCARTCDWRRIILWVLCFLRFLRGGGALLWCSLDIIWDRIKHGFTVLSQICPSPPPGPFHDCYCSFPSSLSCTARPISSSHARTGRRNNTRSCDLGAVKWSSCLSCGGILTGPFSAVLRERPRRCWQPLGINSTTQAPAFPLRLWGRSRHSKSCSRRAAFDQPWAGDAYTWIRASSRVPSAWCCASLSSQICRLMRHRNTFPPSRLVSHRILGRARGNDVHYFPRPPLRSRGHAILTPRRRGHAARKVRTAAAQLGRADEMWHVD